MSDRQGHQNQHTYSAIPTSTVTGNPLLSWEAQGVYSYLSVSGPATLDELSQGEGCEPVDEIQAALGELIDGGYVEVKS